MLVDGSLFLVLKAKRSNFCCSSEFWPNLVRRSKQRTWLFSSSELRIGLSASFKTVDFPFVPSCFPFCSPASHHTLFSGLQEVLLFQWKLCVPYFLFSTFWYNTRVDRWVDNMVIWFLVRQAGISYCWNDFF